MTNNSSNAWTRSYIDIVTEDSVDAKLVNKQDVLVSTQNIKTVNGESLLGSGNITISGGGGATYTAGTNIDITNGVISVTGINVPTKTSDLTNDSGFLTEHQSLSNYSTTTQMNSAISTATNDMATQTWVSGQGYLTEHQDIKTINNTNIVGTGNINVGTVTSVEILSGNGIDVVGNPITSSGSITISLPTTVVGSTTVNSISNIPVTHRAVLATISANGTLSFASLPADGYEVHVIVRNSGSSTISITLPSSGNYVCTSESTIYVAAGKYGEVNVMTIGSTGYVHGISSI